MTSSLVTIMAVRPSFLVGQCNSLRAYWLATVLLWSVACGGGNGTGGGTGGGSGGIGPGNGGNVAGSSGQVEVLAGGEEQPSDIVVDDTYVYWVSGNHIRRVAKAAGFASTVYTADVQGSSAGIAVDEQYLYWGDMTKLQVMRGPKAGGTATVLGPGGIGLALDGDYLYWLDFASGMEDLVRARRDGAGTVETLATYVLAQTPLAFDDQYVYWGVSHENQQVKRTAKAGGGPVTDVYVVSSDRWVEAIAVAQGMLYVDSFAGLASTGRLEKLPVEGGAAVTLVDGVEWPQHIRLAGGSVYMITGYSSVSGSLVRVPSDGGAATVLASELNYPSGLATDAEYVYFSEAGDWLASSGGRVCRIRR